jgi:hypothetical protein
VMSNRRHCRVDSGTRLAGITKSRKIGDTGQHRTKTLAVYVRGDSFLSA